MSEQTQRRWFVLVIVHTVLVQIITFMLRPTMAYKALELGVPVVWLGVISASFALIPLLIAIPLGGAIDRRGERPAMLLGSALILLAAMTFLWLGELVAWLVVGSLILGAGHLFCVVGQQALVANGTAAGRYDTIFGRYTFAAALGQAIGPGLIIVLGGNARFPETASIFIAALVISGLLLVLSLVLRGPRTRQQLRVSTRSGLSRTMGIPGIYRALFASSMVLVAVDITLIYLPALGAERGLSSGLIGTLLVVRAAASMTSRLFLGRLSRRAGRQRLLLSSILLAAISLALVAIPMPAPGLIVLVGIAGLALGVGQPLTMSWLAETTPPGYRGTAMSLRLMANRVGQVALPGAIGLVAAGAGVAGVLGVTAAGLVTAGVFLGNTTVDPHAPEADQ